MLNPTYGFLRLLNACKLREWILIQPDRISSLYIFVIREVRNDKLIISLKDRG
jgi:hypothetical protein